MSPFFQRDQELDENGNPIQGPPPPPMLQRPPVRRFDSIHSLPDEAPPQPPEQGPPPPPMAQQGPPLPPQPMSAMPEAPMPQPQGPPQLMASAPTPMPSPPPNIAPPRPQMQVQEDQGDPSQAGPMPPPSPPQYSVQAEQDAGPPQPPQSRIGQDPMQLEFRKGQAQIAKKAYEKVPLWRQITGAALSVSPRLRGVGQAILHPPDKLEEAMPTLQAGAKYAEQEQQAQSGEALKTAQIKESAAAHAVHADTLETNAQTRKLNAETAAQRIAEIKSSRNRAFVVDRLKGREGDASYQPAGAPRHGGDWIADPEKPGFGWDAPPAYSAMPQELAPFIPGARPGDMIPHSELLKARAASVASTLETTKAGNRPITNEFEAYLKRFGGDTEKATLAFNKEMAQRAIASRPVGQANDNRSDKSYQFQVGELNKIGKPVAEAIARLGRLQDTLAQNSPQADALVAPELLTVMAGGAGSGLRMNEAEIARIVGGRSNWETLKASINKWQLDPKEARSITPSQQKQIRDLVQTVSDKANAKQAAIDEAHQSLIGTNDPAQHRQIVNTARQKFAATDRPPQSPPHGNMPQSVAGKVVKWGRDEQGNPVRLP